MKWERYSEGGVVFQEGDPDDKVYLLVQGSGMVYSLIEPKNKSIKTISENEDPKTNIQAN